MYPINPINVLMYIPVFKPVSQLFGGCQSVKSINKSAETDVSVGSSQYWSFEICSKIKETTEPQLNYSFTVRHFGQMFSLSVQTGGSCFF